MHLHDRPTSPVEHHRAFTVLEALVVLSVSAGVLVLILSLHALTRSGFRTALAQHDATLAAERALRQLARELRTAQIGVDGSYPMQIANDQEIVLLSDVDGDTQAEWLRYRLVHATSADGGYLERSVVEPSATSPRYDPLRASTTTVVRGIRNGTGPIFTYFNAAYPRDTANNPLPTPSRLSETRHIRFSLDINLDPPATRTTRIISAATVRNLREQY